jgi:hypothetical protein
VISRENANRLAPTTAEPVKTGYPWELLW